MKQYDPFLDIDEFDDKNVLLRYAGDKAMAAREESIRFAYYTTADTAIKLLLSQSIWMRSTTVMNDRQEVLHGLALVREVISSTAGRRLMGLVEKECRGLFGHVLDVFNRAEPSLLEETFIACLSEHRPCDDEFGRLSMWRAYGGAAGVAIVIDGEAMFGGRRVFSVEPSPVLYGDIGVVTSEFTKLADSIERNSVGHLGADVVYAGLHRFLRMAVVATKHPAFKEEMEWRWVANPESSRGSAIRTDIEAVGGIPQRVMKLPLVCHPSQGVLDLSPSGMIRKVLIGPCEYPGEVRRALEMALSKAGVDSPEKIISDTKIPLRPNQR